MLKSWLGWINLFLAFLIFAVLVAAATITLLREGEIPHFEGPIFERQLPKNSINFEKAAYDSIGSSALDLQFSPLSIQLPDLRKVLAYYGKNGRPDAQLQTPLLHFSFQGNKTTTSIPPSQPIYIKYDRKQTPPQYIFSPENKETPLWIEVNAQGNQAAVDVKMLNDAGVVITEPQANAQFLLSEKENAKSTGVASTWEISRFRADGTLLARQKARWYGTDKFLERHGGSEYANLVGKQRVDFGEGDGVYSIYLGPEDAVIWDGNQWKAIEPGSDTLAFPLMAIKKIDDRLMTFELWDVEGKNKVVLNLLKSTETLVPQNIQQTFKFVGAHTRSQFVFEINKERVMLSPQDWLIQVDGEWKKLTTPEEIDAYVNRKLVGLLFIFDDVEKRDDRQVLLGTLFNSNRSDMQQIEIPMQKSNSKEEAPLKVQQRSGPEVRRDIPPATLPSPETMRGRTLEEESQ